ncbi:MAG: metal-dependent hydrolase [Halobacteria archaeon]|nr:metal-dependent hydrolase [Halobacteria archaeon]
MEIRYHGHAFFEIEAENGTQILIDPFTEGNNWNDVTPDDFDPDVVAVTHGHFDHVAEAHEFDATVIAQPEVAGYLGKQGHEDSVGMNVGGSYEHDGVEFQMTKAFHSSGTPGEADFDGYGGTPAGYVIDDGETSFYHAGDTALFGDMEKVIGGVYDPDVAAVPIGDHFTMGIDEAAVAVDWLGVETAIPIHYDTFPPIQQNPDEFAEKVDDAEVEILDAGEGIRA